MQNFKMIFQGWTKYIFDNDKVEPKAMEKAKVCFQCEFKVKMKLDVFKDNALKKVENYACGICHCPLSAKLRSDGECPKNKF